MAKTREAKPGELREIKIVETLERFSRRPESRIDVQRMLEALSPGAQTYIRHLAMSGPSSILSAAKALKVTAKEIEAALEEIEKGLQKIRG
jgi:hypothetical protein